MFPWQPGSSIDEIRPLCISSFYVLLGLQTATHASLSRCFLLSVSMPSPHASCDVIEIIDSYIRLYFGEQHGEFIKNCRQEKSPKDEFIELCYFKCTQEHILFAYLFHPLVKT